MNIPENGRIVIIDDEIEEALPLIKVLSNNGVSARLFTGHLDSLPKEQLSDIRVVFLDLKLTPSTNEAIVISKLSGILKKTISESNGPYILILWSKHEADYRNQLNALFGDALQSLRPVFLLTLEKSTYLRTNKRGERSFVPNALRLIEKRLRAELTKIGGLHLIILWENLVHKAAGETVTNVSSLYPINDDWNNRIADVFHAFAQAQVGKQLHSDDIATFAQNSLLTHNAVFADVLEKNIRQQKFSDLELDISDKDPTLGRAERARLNTHLLIMREKDTTNPSPGNVYKLRGNRYKLKTKELFQGDNGAYNALLGSLKYVVMEVSPSCDFAQDKWRMNRLLPGVIWPADSSARVKKAEYIYRTPELELENAVFVVVFDLRYLTSTRLSEFKAKKPAYRFRSTLLNDLQQKISYHIARSGIVNL